MRRSLLWPILGALVGGGIAFAIALALAGDDVGKAGDYRSGALRFIGMVGAIGVVGGFLAVARLTRGPRYTRDGFTLVYKPIAPVAANYRELVTIKVSDLLAALRELGYEPTARACTIDGQRLDAPLDPNTAIAGTNVAFVDPRVRGWIRLQLPVPADGQARAMGLLEIWCERGDSAEEMALYVLRILDTLVGNLAAARESSRLGEDPVSLVTAGLADRPRYRS